MKRDNYKNPCVLTITKHTQKQYDYDFYTLRYENEGEEWELYGLAEDILAELGEHMNNMTAKIEKANYKGTK